VFPNSAKGVNAWNIVFRTVAETTGGGAGDEIRGKRMAIPLRRGSRLNVVAIKSPKGRFWITANVDGTALSGGAAIGRGNIHELNIGNGKGDRWSDAFRVKGHESPGDAGSRIGDIRIANEKVK
jgi:hypothetical protein